MKKIFLSFVFLMLPAISLVEAAVGEVPSGSSSGGSTAVNNSDAFQKILGLIGNVQTILFALAFLFFFYGLVNFLLKDGEDKDKAKGTMIWGIVALFVMFSIYGILSLLKNTVDLDDSASNLTVPAVIGSDS